MDDEDDADERAMAELRHQANLIARKNGMKTRQPEGREKREGGGGERDGLFFCYRGILIVCVFLGPHFMFFIRNFYQISFINPKKIPYIQLLSILSFLIVDSHTREHIYISFFHEGRDKVLSSCDRLMMMTTSEENNRGEWT
jgi:hypothetical protein